MTAAEDLTREILTLLRGLRELAASAPDAGGQRIELATAAVLGTVGATGPLRLSELADRLGLDVSTVSRQVAGLERSGWVSRAADPGDKRAALLRLTAEGERVLAARRAAQAELLTRALPSWSEQEIAGLAHDLARLNADLSAHRTARSHDLHPGHVHPETP